MISGQKKRIEFDVERHHIGHIRCCLDTVPHEDFHIAPILSGWNRKGYWSSEYAFSTIGNKVRIAFTAHIEPIRPLIAAGFGILAAEILIVKVSDPTPANDTVN